MTLRLPAFTARFVVVALLGLAVAACRERPDEDGAAPYARVVAESIEQIERGTGLTFKRPPVLEVHSKEQVREFLVRRFDEQSPASEMAAEEQVFKTLGLIPPDMDYRRFLLDLLNEQIVGYYDPRADKLYVVEGQARDATNIAIAHELIHALQAQYVNLDSIQGVTGDVDRQLAVQSVLEGQATFEQMSAMAGGDISLRIPGGWDQIRRTIREVQGEMPLFANAPLVIQESLLFPYLSGADFVHRFKAQRGRANPLDDLPVSTEQVLHSRAYFGATRDVPSVITLPAPAIGEKVYENGIGEFGTRVFVYEHTNDQNTAVQAAMGWDGDRYVLTRTAAGHSIAWVSVWDSDLDAAEYASAMAETVMRRYGGLPEAAAGSAAGAVRRASGRGRTVEIRTREAAGRTLVLYVDVPEGQSTDVIDLAAVKLEAR
ncbi:MAG: hypothetical protein H0X64_07005 [Gemmatimonadaceae bacterium]|nr:hypothetical protein [Gemmatimonadaceae bacterium]